GRIDFPRPGSALCGGLFLRDLLAARFASCRKGDFCGLAKALYAVARQLDHIRASTQARHSRYRNLSFRKAVGIEDASLGGAVIFQIPVRLELHGERDRLIVYTERGVVQRDWVLVKRL